MAQMGDNQKQYEQEFMKDFWNFRKAFGTPEDRDAYWDAVLEAYEGLSLKYGANPYFDCILTLAVDELDERLLNRSKHDGKRALSFFNGLRKARGLLEVEEKK